MSSLDKFLLFVALPAVVLASLLEAIVLARIRSYDWRASAVSLLDLVLRIGVQIFLPLSIAAPVIALVYRHRWRPHQLLLWDNRCTMHRATEYDPHTERRVVRRCTVLGEEPVGISA